MTPTATVCLMSRTAKRPKSKNMFHDFCLCCLTPRPICTVAATRWNKWASAALEPDRDRGMTLVQGFSPCTSKILVPLQFQVTAFISVSQNTLHPDTRNRGVSFPETNINVRCLTERRIIREALNTHGFSRDHINDGSISRFQEFGAILQLLARTTINLLLKLSKFARNVSGMAIQHRGIASSFHGRVILAVTSNITTANILHRHVLNIEANVVTRQSFAQGFVVHLNRFNFSCYIDWGKCNHHAWLQNTCFHTANRYSTNA
uniref:Uncharacterized protein n=1 Tax=Serinus canaria TaxID=9135 RepID=A0A8C9MY21_SERCA